LFSILQDYDPKGSGVLRADDIPVAMGAAVSLFNQRFNTNRYSNFKFEYCDFEIFYIF
jgi:hypothetical protein